MLQKRITSWKVCIDAKCASFVQNHMPRKSALQRISFHCRTSTTHSCISSRQPNEAVHVHKNNEGTHNSFAHETDWFYKTSTKFPLKVTHPTAAESSASMRLERRGATVLERLNSTLSKYFLKKNCRMFSVRKSLYLWMCPATTIHRMVQATALKTTIPSNSCLFPPTSM